MFAFPACHTGSTVFSCKVPTAPRREASGQKCSSFRLAHTVRTGKQVCQVHLLNLGAKFPVPEDAWPALLALVDDIRADQPPLLQRQGIHTNWAGIWNRLASWMRVTTTMKTKPGELITVRQDTCADAGEAELARAVGMEPKQHRQRRRTGPPKIPAS